jgi:hypothetical protein
LHDLTLGIMAAGVRVGDVVTFRPGSKLYVRGLRRGVVISTDETLATVFERWARLYGESAEWFAERFRAMGGPLMAPGWQSRRWPVVRVDPHPGCAVAIELHWFGPEGTPIVPDSITAADRN